MTIIGTVPRLKSVAEIELERLNERSGHRHTKADLLETEQRLVLRPESFDERDAVILAYFRGEKAVAKARAARDRARRPASPAGVTATASNFVEKFAAACGVEVGEPATVKMVVAALKAALEYANDDNEALAAKVDALAATVQRIEDNAAHMAEVVALRNEVTELRSAVDALREQVASKTSIVKSIVEYKGVWTKDTAYGCGSAVTCGGSLWIARADTSEKPGDGATKWQLAVKAGRDGRDGKDGKDLR